MWHVHQLKVIERVLDLAAEAIKNDPNCGTRDRHLTTVRALSVEAHRLQAKRVPQLSQLRVMTFGVKEAAKLCPPPHANDVHNAAVVLGNLISVNDKSAMRVNVKVTVEGLDPLDPLPRAAELRNVRRVNDALVRERDTLYEQVKVHEARQVIYSSELAAARNRCVKLEEEVRAYRESGAAVAEDCRNACMERDQLLAARDAKPSLSPGPRLNDLRLELGGRTALITHAANGDWILDANTGSISVLYSPVLCQCPVKHLSIRDDGRRCTVCGKLAK